MSTRIIFLGLYILFFTSGYSQTNPVSYKLEKNTQINSAANTPVGNSIGDIIVNTDTIWLSSGLGLSKSTDRGIGWFNFGNEIFGGEQVFSFDYCRGIICAATGRRIKTEIGEYDKGSGIKMSTDGGNTWYSLSQSVDDQSDSIIVYGNNKIRALPITATDQNVSYDLAITSQYIWTANWAGGLRRIKLDEIINNKNPRWERIVLPPDFLTEIKPTDSLKFSLQPQANKKFGPESYRNHVVFSILAVNDSLIYAGTANGINISSDGGSSWKNVNYSNSNLSGNWVTSLKYNYSNNSFWAATWKTDKLGEIDAVSFSIDGGNNWEVVLDNEKAFNFGFTSNDVLVPTDDGMFRSPDMGRNWISAGPVIDTYTKLPLNTNVFYSAATQDNLIWLGSENGLVRFEEADPMWIGKWRIYLASQPLLSNQDTYAFPNPFSPDFEKVKIKYSTSGKRQSVTIRIFDFGMNLVKTVIQNSERGNPIYSVESEAVVDYWDGKDDFGSIVPNGVYFYRVDLSEGNPVFGKIMVLM